MGNCDSKLQRQLDCAVLYWSDPAASAVGRLGARLLVCELHRLRLPRRQQNGLRQLPAASLFHLVLHGQRDAADLITFDHEIRNYIRPSTRQGQPHRFLAGLEQAEACARTDFSKPARYFQEFLKRRGIVLIVSDFGNRRRACFTLSSDSSCPAVAKAEGWTGVKFFYALNVDPGDARVIVLQPNRYWPVDTWGHSVRNPDKLSRRDQCPEASRCFSARARATRGI